MRHANVGGSHSHRGDIANQRQSRGGPSARKFVSLHQLAFLLDLRLDHFLDLLVAPAETSRILRDLSPALARSGRPLEGRMLLVIPFGPLQGSGKLPLLVGLRRRRAGLLRALPINVLANNGRRSLPRRIARFKVGCAGEGLVCSALLELDCRNYRDDRLFPEKPARKLPSDGRTGDKNSGCNACAQQLPRYDRVGHLNCSESDSSFRDDLPRPLI
jgi:hypothetical protein